MKNLVSQYLKDKELAWAPTTLRNEEYRLFAVTEHLDGKPRTLWDALVAKGLKPYSRLTVWTRVCDFWDWAIKEKHIKGINVYEHFREKNARLFKNVYDKKKPELSYAEAFARISTIADDQIRASALTLLRGGLRISELRNIRPDSTVIGKGAKARRVFVSPLGFEFTQGHAVRLRAALRERGLKPHDLRKLFSTELVAKGANEFVLCDVMGWSSLQTASSYVKANAEQARMLVQAVQGGISNVQVPEGVSGSSRIA